jgi:hypothetical protein
LQCLSVSRQCSPLTPPQVPKPFFNEPGYERQMNTPQGDQQSRQYNEAIRVATIEHAVRFLFISLHIYIYIFF